MSVPSVGPASDLVSLRPSPGRSLVSLLVATLGYGLTFWAWTLIGPIGWASERQPSVGDATLTLVTAVTVIVGSVGRVPVGMLTDRYGAQIVLPAVSVAAALAVLMLAAVGSGPALVGLAVALGVAGTTFAAGSALVVRAYPPARRGMALSVFGAGMGIASTAALLFGRFLTVNHHVGLPMLALAMVGYAVLAAAVIRDRPDWRSSRVGHWRIGVDVLRLPAVRYLSAWYAVAFGGLVALGLYLPAYLRHVYRLDTSRSVLVTAACLTVAAGCRPVAGWLCRRHDPVGLLRVCFAASAALTLVLAFQPPLITVAVPVLFGVAGWLGLASGVVQATIGATVPPERAGTIAGTIGAVGGLAGLLPPVLLAAVHGVNGSYGIGLTVLAAATLACAAYLHIHRWWIGAALAFPATIGARHTCTTVVALSVADSASHPPQIIAPLVTLASEQEMVIVSVIPRRAGSDHGGYPLVTGLRLHLPRHRVVAVVVGSSPLPYEIELIEDLIGDGALPVVLTTSTNPNPTALHLADALRADHVLNLTHHHSDGILFQTSRAPATAAMAGPPRPGHGC